MESCRVTSKRDRLWVIISSRDRHRCLLVGETECANPYKITENRRCHSGSKLTVDITSINSTNSKTFGNRDLVKSNFPIEDFEMYFTPLYQRHRYVLSESVECLSLRTGQSYKVELKPSSNTATMQMHREKSPQHISRKRLGRDIETLEDLLRDLTLASHGPVLTVQIPIRHVGRDGGTLEDLLCDFTQARNGQEFTIHRPIRREGMDSGTLEDTLRDLTLVRHGQVLTVEMPIRHVGSDIGTLEDTLRDLTLARHYPVHTVQRPIGLWQIWSRIQKVELISHDGSVVVEKNVENIRKAIAIVNIGHVPIHAAKQRDIQDEDITEREIKDKTEFCIESELEQNDTKTLHSSRPCSNGTSIHSQDSLKVLQESETGVQETIISQTNKITNRIDKLASCAIGSVDNSEAKSQLTQIWVKLTLEIQKALKTSQPRSAYVIVSLDKRNINSHIEETIADNIDRIENRSTANDRYDFCRRNGNGTAIVTCIGYISCGIAMTDIVCEGDKGLMLMVDRYQRNAAHHAAICGHYNLLKTFLGDMGIPVCTNSSNQLSILHLAVMFGRENIVEYICEAHFVLINEKDSIGRHAAHIAVQKNNLKILKVLVNHGANVYDPAGDGSTILHIGASHEDTSIIRYICDEFNFNELNIPNKLGMHPIHFAARCSVQNIQILLDKGERPDIQTGTGSTILHIAACHGRLDILNYLCERHSVLIKITDKIGQSATHHAARKGHVECLNYLHGVFNILVTSQT